MGGTINEDDHLFGLAAARKYGGIFVPPNLAVIHQYVREMMTQCGGMILGSDSHTRYGALGVMGVGEGGPELVKQLLGKTYDLPRPQVVAVWLEGAPRPGVGPQDVALALVEAVFKSGFVKNKVLEFMGPGVAGLSVEYRCGVDVMTTETTCLSSIWTTDDKVRDYMRLHGREADYAPLQLEGPACYEACIRVDLSRVTPMIALPFHPSNAWPVAEVVKHPKDIFAAVEAEAVRQFGDVAKGLNLCAKIHDKGVWVDQGVIAGCAGGSFENISLAAAVLNGQSTGNAAFSLRLPGQRTAKFGPGQQRLLRQTHGRRSVAQKCLLRPLFRRGRHPGPRRAFYPSRHPQLPQPRRLQTRQRPALRRGSHGRPLHCRHRRQRRPPDPGHGSGLVRSELSQVDLHYRFEPLIYHRRVFNGFGHAQPETPLVFGPNIADWPRMSPLPQHLLLQVASVITDPVTTTDELIPSGETSSLRSNPSKLAEYTLSRKDPGYVERAKAVQQMEKRRQEHPDDPHLLATARALFALCGQDLLPSGADLKNVGLGSTIFALKPGDGSAREQAASCQKVLGGWANLAAEYATKRYRSNLINWGMLPFIVSPDLAQTLRVGDWLAVPHIRDAVQNASPGILAYVLRPDAPDGAKCEQIALTLRELTADERQIILDGCLINFYNNSRGE